MINPPFNYLSPLYNIVESVFRPMFGGYFLVQNLAATPPIASTHQAP